MLCYAMLSYAILCCAGLCYTMLCYTLRCYAGVCYAMLCHAMPMLSYAMVTCYCSAMLLPLRWCCHCCAIRMTMLCFLCCCHCDDVLCYMRKIIKETPVQPTTWTRSWKTATILVFFDCLPLGPIFSTSVRSTVVGITPFDCEMTLLTRKPALPVWLCTKEFF